MERLTKRQKEILRYLDDAYPHKIPKWEIFHEFDDRDTRIETKILEKNKLIAVYRYSGIPKHRGTRYKLGDISLTITPKGKEKLQENFKTRLMDAMYNNPLKAVSVVIALILGILGLIITLWK
jgi:hypothetical protein